MKYRVTIEAEDIPTDSVYYRWHEVYQQELEDIDVSSVVAGLNGTQQLPSIIIPTKD